MQLLDAAFLDDAVNRDDIAEVQELLNRGIDPNIRGVVGETPLMAAAWIGSAQIVELLLARGADPRITDSEGRTALQRLLANTDYWHDGHDAAERLLTDPGSGDPPKVQVQRQIPDVLRRVCEEIVRLGWSVKKWSDHEADDWWQSDHLQGGFDATELAFCFSYYSPVGQEWWFQITLQEVLAVASGANRVLPARRAPTCPAV